MFGRKRLTAAEEKQLADFKKNAEKAIRGALNDVGENRGERKSCYDCGTLVRNGRCTSASCGKRV